MKQLPIFLFVVFILSGCSRNCEYAIDLKDIKADVKVNRLEKELFSIKTPEDVQKFIIKHPLVAHRYLGLSPENSSDFVQTVYEFYTNKDLYKFYQEGEKINEGFPELNNKITDLFRHIKYYYPSYRIPELNTIVTGFSNNDFYIDDTVAVISIDYFYGKRARYRPTEYAYMLERREPEFIAPGLALRVALEKFVERDDKDETLLADMITWGKIHYFMERMMPCAHDSTIIMYSSQQIKEVEDNMDILWGHFIENKLFYETRQDVKRRYVEESPKVSVIGEKCPGRIGRYIGWQIVKAYMEKNPKVTIPELMKERNALKIFTLSKYKPRKK